GQEDGPQIPRGTKFLDGGGRRGPEAPAETPAGPPGHRAPPHRGRRAALYLSLNATSLEGAGPARRHPPHFPSCYNFAACGSWSLRTRPRWPLSSDGRWKRRATPWMPAPTAPRGSSWPAPGATTW